MPHRPRRGPVRRRLARRCGLLGVWLAGAGCYRYTDVQPLEAPVGREVRVRLSQEAYVRLAAAVGDQLPGFRRTFDGSLVEVNAQRLLVAVRVATDPRVSRAALHQRVAVPVADVQQLEVRQIDRKKVMLIGAGAGVALGALIARFLGGAFGGTTGPFPEPGPGEMAPLRGARD